MRSNRLKMVALLLASALLCPLLAQQPPPFQQLPFVAPQPPAPTGLAAAGNGASGGSNYWYWVVAIYPIGKSGMTGPAAVRGVAVVSGANTITVRWNAAAGATGYDVLKTTTVAAPVSGCACALAANTSATTATDTGGALAVYNISAITPAASGQFFLNNLNYAQRRLTLNLPLFVTDAGGIYYPDGTQQITAYTGGVVPGTVTSFSSGDLSPLFTTSVATPATTPALSFSLTSALANLVFASPDGAPGVGSYRALVAADLPASSGDILSVGNCHSGVCFSGTQGSTLTILGSSSGAITLQAEAAALGGTVTLPTAPTDAAVPGCVLYTFSNNGTNWTVNGVAGAAIGAGVTQSVTLFALGARQKAMGVTEKTTTAWSGTGFTSFAQTVGDSAGGATFYSAVSYDLDAAVTNTNFQDTTMFKSATFAGSNMTVELTANAALNSNVITGVTTILVCLVNLP